MFNRNIYILFVSVIFGFFIVMEIRSFSGITDNFVRDSKSNVFQEIKILKEKNEDLRKEIDSMENDFTALNDQDSALDVVSQEINRYKLLSGDYGVFGAGFSVTLDGAITTPWLIDLVNEFFNSGAQAVAVNGIRMTNKTVGFDTLPQGQIFLNGIILSSPYTLDIIGDSSKIMDILNLPGGIFYRLIEKFPELKIQTTPKDIIKMD